MELGRVYKITMPAHNEWTEETHERKKKLKGYPTLTNIPYPPPPLLL